MEEQLNSKEITLKIKITPVRLFLGGFMSAVIIIALPVGLLSYYRGTKAVPGAAAYNPPTAQQPTAQQPTAAPAKVNFTITKDDHVRGASNAKVTLVEFSDFQCPYCGNLSPTLDQILKDYSGKVRLVYKHFPLSFHPNAMPAAIASECASEQGKFWELHDKIYANQDQLSTDQLTVWAKSLGLNMDQYNSCVSSNKYAARIQADQQLGSQSGVDGTPATFINGELVSGALPYSSFKQLIDAALK
jgi:protein-disulfide isomerase